MTQRSVVIGSGSYLPETILTNDQLATMVDTNDAWITERTGIKTRHIAAKDQHTSDLATAAAKQALDSAGLDAADLDLIIIATTTPDNTFPSTATKVQANIGATCPAFDVQAVCTGFVYALEVADSMAKTGKYQHILVIGADCLSRIVNWEDRGTCILFGDGAGALLLRTTPSDQTQRGIIDSALYADGTTRDLLYTDGGPSQQSAGTIHMQGGDVFKHAVRKLTAITRDLLAKHHFSVDDVDWIIPHQANQRILDAVAEKLAVPEAKRVATVAQHGNTSAASIPLALDAAARDGRIKEGQLLALPAIGGGLTWGVSLIRW